MSISKAIIKFVLKYSWILVIIFMLVVLSLMANDLFFK